MNEIMKAEKRVKVGKTAGYDSVSAESTRDIALGSMSGEWKLTRQLNLPYNGRSVRTVYESALSRNSLLEIVAVRLVPARRLADTADDHMNFL
ncbi:hypothetical protein EVAR_102329_1 [Eumeta japonica]|uniref:Uncharacterized protein n=1 Tax=Eumeta variegata TaxID=151549 RepID=A0A4C1ZF39_EUMVA|nr:hypothetical protein EVAR_102329_1 [Eumeta japonica]